MTRKLIRKDLLWSAALGGHGASRAVHSAGAGARRDAGQRPAERPDVHAGPGYQMTSGQQKAFERLHARLAKVEATRLQPLP